jgi:hypothetical protein
MPDSKKPIPPPRRYPPFYEKAVPIALGIIALAIIVLIIIALSVLLGVFPNPG